jgi:hypothetical protein
MTELEAQVSQVAGQPASVRIGRIAQVNPTVVTVQGAVFTDVGFMGWFSPAVGDTVALLGQSSASGADPASWLVLGYVKPDARGGLQAGQEVMSFGPATSNLVPVVFANPYVGTPVVSTNIASGPASTTGWFSRAINITPLGFDLFVNGPSSTWTDIPVQWQAQEPTQ